MTFDSAHDYGTEAIIIPVILRLGNPAVRTDAYLDRDSINQRIDFGSTPNIPVLASL